MANNTEMKRIGPERRYADPLPKIGIRPAIDGRRRGVRESLEDQTMNMAKAAAKLISDNLRHTTGEPVECIIADTTIGGVAEAVACQAKFSRENVAVTLTVTEFLILQALAQRPGHVKSRDQLMDAAYDDQVYVDDRTIDSHIKRLRKKFKTVDEEFSAIETLYGIGYKFDET